MWACSSVASSALPDLRFGVSAVGSWPASNVQPCTPLAQMFPASRGTMLRGQGAPRASHPGVEQRSALHHIHRRQRLRGGRDVRHQLATPARKKPRRLDFRSRPTPSRRTSGAKAAFQNQTAVPSDLCACRPSIPTRLGLHRPASSAGQHRHRSTSRQPPAVAI